jgi:hypothetical protein
MLNKETDGEVKDEARARKARQNALCCGKRDLQVGKRELLKESAEHKGKPEGRVPPGSTGLPLRPCSVAM